MNRKARIPNPNETKKLVIKSLNLLIFLSFLFLSLAWSGLKLSVSQQLSNDISLFAYADIVRSQSSLDLALCLIFLCVFLYTNNTRSWIISTLLFIVMTFYFLKLTGLYVYTYDATPWQMIEYGSYMLSLPFAGKLLSYIGYLVIPFILILLMFYLVTTGWREKQHSGLPVLLPVSVLLIAISFIPPLQKTVPESIAYHPYVYSISGSLESNDNNSKPLLAKTENRAHPSQTMLNKNVIYIVLESVSYSAINADVTPFLEDLKNKSLSFTQARANIPHTSKALISIHCGQTPYFSPYLFESVLGIPEKCLPQQVDAPSVFFQPVTQHFEKREALVKAMGFKDFYPLEALNTKGFEAVNYFSYEDDIVLAQSREWIEEHKQATFIASYLTGTSHHNYDTPDSFEKKHFHDNRKYNRYLNSVAYVDRFVAKLIAQYKQAGIYENSLFIIVGDHGEGFDKSQSLMHNNNIYESGLHIPLLIHFPSSDMVPQKTEQLTMQSDIQTYIQASMYNREKGINDIEENKLSSCWYMQYCYAIFHQTEAALFKLVLDKRNKQTLLFDLKTDPHEKNNISSKYPELVTQLGNALREKVSRNHSHYHSYFKSKHNNYKQLKSHTFSRFKSVDY